MRASNGKVEIKADTSYIALWDTKTFDVTYQGYNQASLSDTVVIPTVYGQQPVAPAVSGSGFEDVAEDAWYAQSVIWAAREGITVGTNAAGTAFSPDVPVSRAQAVTFLYRELAD